MKKLLILFLTGIALALSGTPPAYAAQGEYSRDDGAYHYYFSDGTEFSGNVADGATTDNLVAFKLPDHVSAVAELDGEENEYRSNQYLVAPGDYHMRFYCQEEMLELSFTILQMNLSSGYDITENAVSHIALKQSYDPREKRFVQEIARGYQFYSTIPQNMVSTGAVLFHGFSDELAYVLTRDGVDVKYESGQALTEAGKYRLQVILLPRLNLNGMEEPKEDSLAERMDQTDQAALEKELEQVMSQDLISQSSEDEFQLMNRDKTLIADFYFTISTGFVSDNDCFQAPVGYRIDQVTCDGTELQPETLQKLVLKQDGDYRIQLTGVNSGFPELVTEFTRDTVPPLLTFDGADKQGVAKRRFSISADEENVKLEIFLDGNPVELRESMTAPGLYRIQVEDQAGNGTTYLIRVKGTLRIWFLGLGVLALGILFEGMYLYFKRQGITVR